MAGRQRQQLVAAKSNDCVPLALPIQRQGLCIECVGPRRSRRRREAGKQRMRLGGAGSVHAYGDAGATPIVVAGRLRPRSASTNAQRLLKIEKGPAAGRAVSLQLTVGSPAGLDVQTRRAAAPRDRVPCARFLAVSEQSDFRRQPDAGSSTLQLAVARARPGPGARGLASVGPHAAAPGWRAARLRIRDLPAPPSSSRSTMKFFHPFFVTLVMDGSAGGACASEAGVLLRGHA